MKDVFFVCVVICKILDEDSSTFDTMDFCGIWDWHRDSLNKDCTHKAQFLAHILYLAVLSKTNITIARFW